MIKQPIRTLARICGALLIVAGITAFYFFIFNQANSTTIALTFLLGTLGIATWWGLLEAIVASVAGVLVYALVATVVGQSNLVTTHLLVVAAVVGVFNALVAPFALRLVRWSISDPAGERAFA